ncbi:Plexin domain-containing protein 2 [Branchiostoma belcheri]|nr:Plexin domain-containing protein 2 [Branchiostoma belcheri]
MQQQQPSAHGKDTAPGAKVSGNGQHVIIDASLSSGKLHDVSRIMRNSMRDPESISRDIVDYRNPLRTSFTVEWSKVKLRGSGEGGRFSFMVTLFKDGRIAYFYKEALERIDDSSYPVRVGISDAYTVDVLLYPSANGHRKTIYEYNTIDLDLAKVKNGSSFLLSPLPTCTQFSDCQSCISASIGFECRWCRSLRSVVTAACLGAIGSPIAALSTATVRFGAEIRARLSTEMTNARMVERTVTNSNG